MGGSRRLTTAESPNSGRRPGPCLEMASQQALLGLRLEGGFGARGRASPPIPRGSGDRPAVLRELEFGEVTDVLDVQGENETAIGFYRCLCFRRRDREAVPEPLTAREVDPTRSTNWPVHSCSRWEGYVVFEAAVRYRGDRWTRSASSAKPSLHESPRQLSRRPSATPNPHHEPHRLGRRTPTPERRLPSPDRRAHPVRYQVSLLAPQRFRPYDAGRR